MSIWIFLIYLSFNPLAYIIVGEFIDGCNDVALLLCVVESVYHKRVGLCDNICYLCNRLIILFSDNCKIICRGLTEYKRHLLGDYVN